MARFFINPDQVSQGSIEIIGDDVNHIKNVLRISVGDDLTLCDGTGKDYEGTIDIISNTSIKIAVRQIIDSVNEPQLKVTLYQGLPKKDKMELIIQKAVELGVHEIVPVMMERVIVQLKDKKKEQKKVDRWNKISEAAAKQSRRGIIPVIKSPVSYQEAIKLSQANQLNLMAYENEKNSLKSVLEAHRDVRHIGILIGPEGGLTEVEVKEAIEQGFRSISLGKRILRTETAGLALTSVIMYAFDEM
ncbi:16S rRNA (uracil(1498)-N(3))-methyltransferase [Vallitalea okinawensis]|uniref:16S rRNA (uracil(1498)-N(3))-methyltransferase n=1 Tax=Vallitalea okinawensis TaxID=2078660 RepID=UPI000CFD33F4|nr:16S rRNA (uracil(1498)-N(3))-methyltransferase [Vallitalea okinawensis]